MGVHKPVSRSKMSTTKNYLYFLLLTISISTTVSISFEFTPFECTKHNSPICMNGGGCFSYYKITQGYIDHDICFCEAGFYGPHCEYKNEMSRKFVHRLKNLPEQHHEKRLSE